MGGGGEGLEIRKNLDEEAGRKEREEEKEGNRTLCTRGNHFSG